MCERMSYLIYCIRRNIHRQTHISHWCYRLSGKAGFGWFCRLRRSIPFHAMFSHAWMGTRVFCLVSRFFRTVGVDRQVIDDKLLNHIWGIQWSCYSKRSLSLCVAQGIVTRTNLQGSEAIKPLLPPYEWMSFTELKQCAGPQNNIAQINIVAHCCVMNTTSACKQVAGMNSCAHLPTQLNDCLGWREPLPSSLPPRLILIFFSISLCSSHLPSFHPQVSHELSPPAVWPQGRRGPGAERAPRERSGSQRPHRAAAGEARQRRDGRQQWVTVHSAHTHTHTPWWTWSRPICLPASYCTLVHVHLMHRSLAHFILRV